MCGHVILWTISPRVRHERTGFVTPLSVLCGASWPEMARDRPRRATRPHSVSLVSAAMPGRPNARIDGSIVEFPRCRGAVPPTAHRLPLTAAASAARRPARSHRPRSRPIRRPRQRFHLHFTPTSSSWLNLVVRWFRNWPTSPAPRSVPLGPRPHRQDRGIPQRAQRQRHHRRLDRHIHRRDPVGAGAAGTPLAPGNADQNARHTYRGRSTRLLGVRSPVFPGQGISDSYATWCFLNHANSTSLGVIYRYVDFAPGRAHGT